MEVHKAVIGDLEGSLWLEHGTGEWGIYTIEL